jgi:glutamate synthase domain-containing protein 3
VSSEIARQYGGKGLPDDTITLRFKGAAGQSFGAFCASGMTLVLEGEANDYVGKGLSGGKIILKPDPGTDFDAASNIIAGNVLLYGATSGEMYINGRVGERFAIRNSGVIAVVEGVGDHGCEYMTRGRVVVIGPTGVNFGAGMSGGIAYVYDETGMFDNNCNLEMIDLELITEKADEEEIRTLLEAHVACTDSKKAREILENWDVCLAHFIKVFPMEYKRVLGKMSREDADTEREEVLDA